MGSGSPVVTPIDSVGDGGGSGSSQPTGGGGPAGQPGANLQSLTLGLNPVDAAPLRADHRTLEHAIALYGYARHRNDGVRREFDILCEFAFGKQFLTYGNELDHNARPRRNITFDTIRHKKGLVTEPPVQVECLPRGPDDGPKAQLAKAILDMEDERLDRRRTVDDVTSWAAIVGTGLTHQGWDPFSQQVVERVVDPRQFDPDPDFADEKQWGYCFETLRLPLRRIQAMFPATGADVTPDELANQQKVDRAAWQPNSAAAAVAMRIGAKQTMDRGEGPDYATVVLYWSRGHYTELAEDEALPRILLECTVCAGSFAADPPAADAGTFNAAAESPEECPACGFGPLKQIVAGKGAKAVPSYPGGRRLVAFAPASDVLLYVGEWPTPEIGADRWPYKSMRWYKDPRRWWGISETAFQWSLQILANKMLVLLGDNATNNAAPKVIIPKGIGFEHKAWTNMPSEKLVATDPRLIQYVRAFQTGDIGQSLVFLVQFALKELKSQGGFDDVAMGNIARGSEISGSAIERAQSASEVPVRDHLRERYRMESELHKDCFEMVRKRWSSKRLVRITAPYLDDQVVWVKGDELPELDVVITSDPSTLIDRTQRADIAMKLLSTPGGPPDPQTGQAPPPVLDPIAVAEWIGIPSRIMRGVQARRAQQGAQPGTLAPGGPAMPGAAPPGFGGSAPAMPPGLAGAAAGLSPQMIGG